ncbi:nitrite reductase small subunit NirD [Microbacterium jejuense]|uniref:Nitrite reductase small subunit NirD n=1 Tax=Microbacterium jejuense TaxID=1263637 RepID=A0ABS7HIX5_9MICO|nr:nitrite reductase small subunit NirD [Microbacterium jejuense]MBW9092901.1 nitrite reductase small subunit NirD [Microbacterium jejuense]
MTLIDPQTTTDTAPAGWVRVCALSDLEVERGRAALLGGTQIALFLTRGTNGREGRVYAVSNFDPFSRANVISRGIVGTRQDAPTVASPMFKQVFDLRTGICLDAQGKEPVNLHVWPTAVADGVVLVRWDERPDADGGAP